MSAHCEVAINAVLSKQIQEGCVTIDEKLEDQRESHEDGILFGGDAQNLLGILLDVDDLDRITVTSKYGCEIAQTQITLVLEADQYDRTLIHQTLSANVKNRYR